MIFLSAQPDETFFHWQLKVQIFNFLKLGIKPRDIHPVLGCVGEISQGGIELQKTFPEIQFHFYLDTRDDRFYIPSIRPHILKKHFDKFPNLGKYDAVFYHDADIIFRELPNFDRMCVGPTWYLSDTVSYIGADYIISKGEELFKNMCNLVGIDQELVKANQNNSGGAQYLMKNIDSNFWRKVEFDSVTLYRYMQSSIGYFKQIHYLHTGKDDYHPIQSWCSDMWAVLWNGLQISNINVSKELDFSWATSDIKQFNLKKIYHNAGVTDADKNTLFQKGLYKSSEPFDVDFSYVDPTKCSYMYCKEIEEAKKYFK